MPASTKQALPTAAYGGDTFSNISQGYGGDLRYTSYYEAAASGHALVNAVKESTGPMILKNTGTNLWSGNYYMTVIAESGGIPLAGFPWDFYAESATEYSIVYGTGYKIHLGPSGQLTDKFGRVRSQVPVVIASGFSDMMDTTGASGFPIYMWAESSSGYITYRLPVEYRVIS